jgi:hypothetical protein
VPDLKSVPWFVYRPTGDTVIAFLTAVLWIGGYYLLTHLNDPPFSTLYYTAAVLAVVLFPLWWVCRHRGRPLAEIGITSRRWKESLLISVIVAIPFLWLITTQYGATYGDALIPHILANALYLWEPFFVFCWLELQFSRSFGIVPGIVLAGVCFGAYHLGTYPLPGIAVLMVYGIVFAAIFSLTENILALWPVAWAASSAKGTLAGGMVFSWDVVVFSAVLVLVQILCIAWVWRKEKAGEGRATG